MTLSSLGEDFPRLHVSTYVAESAQIIGNVWLAAKSSVWFQSVLRGDSDQIVIGEETNVQDVTICHVDPGFPLEVGARVTVVHRCILHGYTINDDCLIGMGAILMNGVRIRGVSLGQEVCYWREPKSPLFHWQLVHQPKLRRLMGKIFLGRFVRQVPIMLVERNTTAATGENSNPRRFVQEHRSSWERRCNGEFLRKPDVVPVGLSLKEPCDYCLADGSKRASAALQIDNQKSSVVVAKHRRLVD